MGREVDDVKNVINKFQKLVYGKKDFHIILNTKKVDKEDQLMSIEREDVIKMRMALVTFDEEKKTIKEIPQKFKIEQHIKMKDFLCLNIKTTKGRFYIAYPMQVSSFINKADGRFNVVFSSFKVFLST